MKQIDYLHEDLDYCLSTQEIKERFYKKSIIVFGAGNDGKLFLNEFHDSYLHIEFFIDNNLGHQFYKNVSIYYPDELMDDIKFPIVIASRDHWRDMLDQMEKKGFLRKRQVFVWESNWPMDVHIDNFIKHNFRIWSNKKNNRKRNKIIIPYGCWMDVTITIHAYCANYLAGKYDAEIWAYTLFNRSERDLNCKSLRDTYKSINVSHIISPRLSAKQKKEADSIFKNLLPKIHTLDDVEQIKIYGYEFGKSIIRNYLRHTASVIEFKSSEFFDDLKKSIEIIVFYYRFFCENHQNIKTVILWDGVGSDSFLRVISIKHNIPTYRMTNVMAEKLNLEGSSGEHFPYYRNFFQQLMPNEKEYGIVWAKKRINDRLNGSIEDIPYAENSVFTCSRRNRILRESKKIKVLICPHTFDDDLFGWGWQVFHGQIEWLCHLGELSEQTDYDWYIKLHPNYIDRDEKILEDLLKKYKKIIRIPEMVSPKQLRDEGLGFAFTIYGTIGHEYTALGIQVVNAGNNPHIAFDFTWNPRTREEFDDIVVNLSARKKRIDMDDIYRFYCIHYLFYQNIYQHSLDGMFFRNESLRDHFKNLSLGSEVFQVYLDEWNPAWHETIKNNVPEFFRRLDEYQNNIFYKKNINL